MFLTNGFTILPKAMPRKLQVRIPHQRIRAILTAKFGSAQCPGFYIRQYGNSMKLGKKTNDSSKIKRSKVKSKASVAHARSKGVRAASPSVQTVHNIPPSSRLREEARMQNRIRHLADNVKPGMGKIKSQRGGAVDVFVNNKVRWPHEFVLSDQNKDRVTYNQLSPI